MVTLPQKRPNWEKKRKGEKKQKQREGVKSRKLTKLATMQFINPWVQTDEFFPEVCTPTNISRNAPVQINLIALPMVVTSHESKAYCVSFTSVS